MTEEEHCCGSEKEEQEETVAAAVDIEVLKTALDEAKAKTEANLAGWQRAQADFANYKRRCEQEKVEATKSANADLLLKLLPIMDDMERALTSIPPEVAEQGWVSGIRLIERKWTDCMEAQGLTMIKAVGERFDPRLHEAVKEDKGKEGFVVLEVQRGYMLADRVLRPSKVIVGNGEKEVTEADCSAEQKDA